MANMLTNINIDGKITASGNSEFSLTDSDDNSITIQGLYDRSGTGSVPVGTIMPYGGSTPPNANWKFCDGSAVSRTTYSELFSIIGTHFGSGDGSTTFNIPDLRETVPVGAGTSTNSSITDHDSYNVGEFKDDQKQSHAHEVGVGWATVGYVNSELTDFNPYYRVQGSSSISATKGGNLLTVSESGRNGTTTHGKQLGVNYIIRVFRTTEEVTTPINYNNIPIEFPTESGIPGANDNIQSGWTFSNLFKRIKSYLANLKTVCFTGSYNDLSNTPYLTKILVAGGVNQADWGAYILNESGWHTYYLYCNASDAAILYILNTSQEKNNKYMGVLVAYDYGNKFHLAWNSQGTISVLYNNTSYYGYIVKLEKIV